MRSDLCCNKIKKLPSLNNPRTSSCFDPYWTMLNICLFLIRISQDLAKDLAMLAREIHDVAGEIDSVSPAATDPGALVQTTNSLCSDSPRFPISCGTDGRSALTFSSS